MPAWILDQWPRVWGGFVYVSFLVWGPAPDWLQPFELIGSSYLDVSSGSVHIVTVSMAVSLFISPTTPTHIPFACVCHRLTFKTQPCNSLTVILFYCRWAQRQVHHQISGVALRVHVCLRVPVRKWHSSVLTALRNCMWWAATGRDPVMFFFLSIPCCTTTSPLLTVISAQWSRNKCFSQSGA